MVCLKLENHNHSSKIIVTPEKSSSLDKNPSSTRCVWGGGGGGYFFLRKCPKKILVFRKTWGYWTLKVHLKSNILMMIWFQNAIVLNNECSYTCVPCMVISRLQELFNCIGRSNLLPMNLSHHIWYQFQWIKKNMVLVSVTWFSSMQTCAQ